MKLYDTLTVAAVLSIASVYAVELSQDEADARLRMALQIARERNDKALVRDVEKAAGTVDDATLRSLETKVGIDPGGWSMAGQPLFHPTPAMREQQKALRDELQAAMASDDAEKVRAATKKMLVALGDQAGIPDGRRMGKKVSIHPYNDADTATLFVKAMGTEAPRLRTLATGKPLPDQMLRLYAGILAGLCDIRPAIQKHASDSLADLDKLASGCAAILVTLQQPEGHFPFPDLRGKNIRFGDMINHQIKSKDVLVKDGWVLSPDPDGGSQFDTGVCGLALLAAGEIYQNAQWTKAGLHAADWALKQQCVANFNYNAFSVSLLAHAYRISRVPKYLEGAQNKFRVGVAPGQAPNGRWMDSHNARTVYHVIILRALGDLGSVLPADQRTELDAIAKPAINSLLDEFDVMGITVEALPEMLTLATLYPHDERLRKATEMMASSIMEKSTDGKRAKFGAAVNQFAAVARVWGPNPPKP